MKRKPKSPDDAAPGATAVPGPDAPAPPPTTARLEPATAVASIEDKLESLPPTPGCYLFIDKGGAVVYVGKAKSLRSRVRSYFQDGSSDDRYFIPILRRIVRDLETVVTASEKEAAVLENQLIKQHKPRFNVKLRDDKDFLCLRLDATKPWPRLETVRRPPQDGARYFGPYHSATSARRTLHLVNKHFKLRTCSDADMAARKRPCLQYQIRRCLAPCVQEVDAGWYAGQVRAVALFLEGRHDELSGELSERMSEAARSMEYELAAMYRDQLRAVEAGREGQRVVAVKDVDQDVVGLYREGSNVEIELITARQGRVNDTLSFSLKGVEIPDEEALSGFLAEYYGSKVTPSLMPDEVLLPLWPEGVEGIAEWLSDRRGRKVSLLVPQRGPRADLLRLAAENAAHAFREKQRHSDDVEARLEDLRERLRLPTLPRRIECCDISHLGGGDTVGSIVALYDGQLDKKRYRSFRVRGVGRREGTPPGAETPEGEEAAALAGDDYAAMYEVLARRFRRGRDAAAHAASAAAAGGRAALETTDLALSDDAEPTAPDESAREAGGGARLGPARPLRRRRRARAAQRGALRGQGPRPPRPAHRGPREGAREPRRREARRPRLPARPEERPRAATDELGAVLPRPRARRGAPLRELRPRAARQGAAAAVRPRGRVRPRAGRAQGDPAGDREHGRAQAGQRRGDPRRHGRHEEAPHRAAEGLPRAHARGLRSRARSRRERRWIGRG